MGISRLKKGISAYPFLPKLSIFAFPAGKSFLGCNILPHPALKLFQFIGLCKKQ